MKHPRPILAWTLAGIFLGVFSTPVVTVYAEQPDPLALPCTIGATAQKTNPYSKKLETYSCEKCGSETCWIIQPARK